MTDYIPMGWISHLTNSNPFAMVTLNAVGIAHRAEAVKKIKAMKDVVVYDKKEIPGHMHYRQLGRKIR